MCGEPVRRGGTRISLPLRLSIPLSLAVLAVVLTGIQIVSLRTNSFQSIERSLLQKSVSLGYLVVPMMERAMLQGDTAGIVELVDSLALTPQLTLAIVCDPAGTVIFSTDYSLRHRGLAATPAAAAEGLIAHARSTAVAQSEIAPDGASVRVAAPFHMGPLTGELRPSRIAVLYIETDLAAGKAQEVSNVVRRSLLISAIVLLASFLVWFYLRATFTRDLMGLQKAVAEYAAGAAGLRVPLARNPELARIGQVLNRMFTEISEQHSALQRSEEQFRAVLENSPDTVYTIDFSTGRSTFCNRETFCGYTLGEMMGPESIFSAVHSDDITAVKKAWEEARAGRHPGPVAYRVRRKDGGLEWIEQRMTALPSLAGGLPRGLIVTLSIVTERKKAEAEHGRLQSQLIQAQKMETVGRLAGGIAHDFNNTLQVINSYSSMVADALDPSSPLREDVLEIHAAGLRAAELTRQLLAFSRRQVLEVRIVDLNRIIEGMSRMLARLIGEDVKLDMRLSTDLRPVIVDVGQMEQVIMNLTVNARDAMPGTGTLTIATENVNFAPDGIRAPDLGSGSYVLLTVKDTGAGMSPEVREHIFEPFFTTKAAGEGTGLGLATVYGIVRQSGGDVTVESEPGQGSTFRIYLPPADGSGDQEEGTTAESAPRGTERILLVEDEPAIRRLTARMLRSLGYAVIEAEDSADALRLSGSAGRPFDLVLTDVTMPGMGGRELVERMGQGGVRPKVLYMSGNPARAFSALELEDTGMRIAVKPFSRADLARKVREALEDR
jgi:PAS domain S-box-containing protein